MITYRKITKETEKDLQIPNEPFDIFGRLIVKRSADEWSYETEMFEKVETMRFPDENYTFEAIDGKGFAVGAYDGDKCVGLAIFEHNWNKYLYLMDLKVSGDYRKKGIAGQLLKAGQELAKELDYRGIYTVGQDNNLAACKFYLKSGFVIGGFNTMDYRHTSQQDKADVYFYLDNE